MQRLPRIVVQISSTVAIVPTRDAARQRRGLEHGPCNGSSQHIGAGEAKLRDFAERVRDLPLARSRGEYRVSIKGRMGRVNRPRHAIVCHPGYLLELGFLAVR